MCAYLCVCGCVCFSFCVVNSSSMGCSRAVPGPVFVCVTVRMSPACSCVSFLPVVFLNVWIHQPAVTKLSRRSHTHTHSLWAVTASPTFSPVCWMLHDASFILHQTKHAFRWYTCCAGTCATFSNDRSFLHRHVQRHDSVRAQKKTGNSWLSFLCQ